MGYRPYFVITNKPIEVKISSNAVQENRGGVALIEQIDVAPDCVMVQPKLGPIKQAIDGFNWSYSEIADHRKNTLIWCDICQEYFGGSYSGSDEYHAMTVEQYLNFSTFVRNYVTELDTDSYDAQSGESALHLLSMMSEEAIIWICKMKGFNDITILFNPSQ